MTVKSIFPDPYGDAGMLAHCEWFDQHEALKFHSFALENNKTLILHFGHERARVEREQRLLDNGNYCE